MPPKPPPDSPFLPRAGQAPQAPRKNPKLDRLNALFSGGGAPAAAPIRNPAVSVGGMESKMRMERLRGATQVAEITAAVDALLGHHQMPDEPDLLCKMLVHPDAGVGERVLAELGSRHAAGKLNVTLTMKEQLKAFESRCREPNALRVLQTLTA